MNMLGIRLGEARAHWVNETWFKEIGVSRSIPFNYFTSRKAYKLGSLNQLFGLIYSFFIPKAKTYVLTSTGCTITTLFKKNLYKSKIISLNSDTFFRDLPNANWVARKYMMWLSKHVDGMISTSHMMKRLAKEYITGPHEIVYPFCNVKKFSKIKINYKSPHICSIGTGIRTKGTDILFEVFKIYNKSFPKSKLYVCGFTEPIARLKKTSNIILPGVVDPVPYLAKSGLYINSSRHESFGVNIIEAMCAGIVPIVTDRCGAAEIVRKVDPWLVTSLDPKEIARKAIQLQKDINKKKYLGAKARKIASTYTEKKSVKDFKKAFFSILRKIE